MFNLGIGELTVIFIVLILAVGPDRMPTLMKSIGKTLRTVQRASRDLRTTVGIDELMREDVMAPPKKRAPPKAALSREAKPIAASKAPDALAENAPAPEGASDTEGVPKAMDAQPAPALPVQPPPPAGHEPPTANGTQAASEANTSAPAPASTSAPAPAPASASALAPAPTSTSAPAPAPAGAPATRAPAAEPAKQGTPERPGEG